MPRLLKRPRSRCPGIVGLSLLFVAMTGFAPRQEDDKLTVAAFEAHNRIREDAGLPKLTRNPLLDASALAHARDMAARREMSHRGSDDSEAAERVDRQKYPYRSVGENVARGQRSADHVMRGWMNSPGHRENILGAYIEVGLAVARDEDGDPYWCVNFGTPWPKLDPAKARRRILQALNDARRREGLEPLRLDDRLNRLADGRAKALAKLKSPEDDQVRRKSFETALHASGYRYASIQDLAAGGLPGPREFVDSLLKNPSHRKSILGAHQEIGTGLATGAHGTPYWDLILATPR